MAVPKHHELFNPVLRAIKTLGGSATIAELDEEATKRLRLTEDEIAEPHNERITELEYRLAWARTYLKTYGLLDNTGRGVWVVTHRGNETETIDPRAVIRFVNQQRKPRKRTDRATDAADAADVADTTPATVVNGPDLADALQEQSWRDELLATLLALRPDAFERLCQRVLRESGFVEVKVTGRAGDGGIDGIGIVQLGGLLGFPVLFQCKRYRGTLSAPAIRDFRGAMQGRADRGIVLTTGTFTRDARREATRDGVPLISLIDGEQLLDKLKELRLGVHVKMIEQVSVQTEWFSEI